MIYRIKFISADADYAPAEEDTGVTIDSKNDRIAWQIVRLMIRWGRVPPTSRPVGEGGNQCTKTQTSPN